MDLGLILLSLVILRFGYNWIKVSIFMWGANIEGSSFKMTFAYMITKKELKDMQ